MEETPEAISKVNSEKIPVQILEGTPGPPKECQGKLVKKFLEEILNLFLGTQEGGGGNSEIISARSLHEIYGDIRRY